MTVLPHVVAVAEKRYHPDCYDGALNRERDRCPTGAVLLEFGIAVDSMADKNGEDDYCR